MMLHLKYMHTCVFCCTSLLTKPTSEWMYYLGVTWAFLAQKGAELSISFKDANLSVQSSAGGCPNYLPPSGPGK